MGSREQEQAEELEAAEAEARNVQRELTVDVPAEVVGFVNVYEPMPSVIVDLRPSYLIIFLTTCLPKSFNMAGIPLKEQEDGTWTIKARSYFRPEVVPLWASASYGGVNCPVDELVRRLARLDARNLPRDRVFDDAGLRLGLETYDYKHPGTGASGRGLCLKRVTVYLRAGG